ncbi:MAG TPA: CBS domain-containing protein, partial [Desulfocapsa sulfexigens]|nr:CBS domain-containing protein [Desulfocapsa sulfexigens]
LGAVLIVDENHRISGIITDGDVRRAVAEGNDPQTVKVDDFMTAGPVTIPDFMQAVDALSIMQQHEITILPVVGGNEELIGILHLHNLLGKGEFRFLV